MHCLCDVMTLPIFFNRNKIKKKKKSKRSESISESNEETEVWIEKDGKFLYFFTSFCGFTYEKHWLDIQSVNSTFLYLSKVQMF